MSDIDIYVYKIRAYVLLTSWIKIDVYENFLDGLHGRFLHYNQCNLTGVSVGY